MKWSVTSARKATVLNVKRKVTERKNAPISKSQPGLGLGFRIFIDALSVHVLSKKYLDAHKCLAVFANIIGAGYVVKTSNQAFTINLSSFVNFSTHLLYMKKFLQS